MSTTFSLLNSLLTKLSLVLIWVYQKTISPDEWILSFALRGKVCAHEPHCSEYARLSLVRYWFLDSIEQIVNRVISCRPSMNKNYDPVSYRVVFASSAPIGVPFLSALADDPRFDIVGVVTQPDQPSGRGMKMQANVIKSEWEKLGLQAEDITTPNTLRLKSKQYPWEWSQFASWLESKKPDFLVVIAYGNIVPQHILSLPTIAPINVHGSLLPQYRWASPIQSVLLDDCAETGITIMRMDAGLDTWPMLRAQWFPLTIHTTALDIIHQFQEFGPQLLIDTMVDYATGKLSEILQPEDGVSHCGKLEKSAWLINPWTQSLHEINNIYRGCYLWPKTYFVLDASWGKHAGKQVIIDTMQLDDELWIEYKDEPLLCHSEWNEVLKDTFLSVNKSTTSYILNSNFRVNPAIKNLLIKPEWSKAMKWEDWLRGV